MKTITLKLSIATIGALLLSACGSGGDSVEAVIPDTAEGDTVHKLAPQSGTQSQLFYGNSKHDALASLSNVMVIDANSPTAVKTSRDSIDSRYPLPSTALTYGENGSYSDLHVKTLSYVADTQAYKISMLKDAETKEVANSSADAGLTGTGRSGRFDYHKVSYLGSTQYLKVINEAGDTLLITPDMQEGDAPLDFNDKTLLTLSFESYGAAANGYILYDSNLSTLQNCTMDLSTCTAISGLTSKPTFLGDLGGTTKSILSVGDTHYILDKLDNTLSTINAATTASKLRASGAAHMLSGDSIYSIIDHNIIKTDLDGTVTQISTDAKADRFKAFTDDMVVYGNDKYMYAVKKDGSNKDAAITISEQDRTSGQKYPHDLGIGKQYLYTLYKINEETGKTTFSACVLEDGVKNCKLDSYWSAVTAAKSGTLNHASTYKYTPYAYIRVDTTDNYGGGKVKAIDPTKPLEDGITMGDETITQNYNFQTIVNSGYDDDIIDSNGDIILYAKSDISFKGNAFLMNLTKEDSLVQLTDEAAPEKDGAINAGSGHCHGRMCTVCHSFSGGKIFSDKEASASAINHTIRFEFEDGAESILAKIRKGSGENFNTPLENLVGKNFMAVVVDENETAVVSTAGYSHKGVGYSNCNYCHRKGDLKEFAPNVISIED